MSPANQSKSPPFNTWRSAVFSRLAGILITVLIPILLVLTGVRLVMTTFFLRLEYERPGFSPDIYGFSAEDRLRYAPFALEYLIDEKDICFLANQMLPDGRFMFNMRELDHMRDVQVVTQIAFRVLGTTGLLVMCAFAYMTLRTDRRPLLRYAALRGGLLTLGMVVVVVIISLVNWDLFFTGFHQVFFTEGTWRFDYSDTLIRLFPEQFWLDAAIAVGGFTGAGAIGLILAVLACSRK